MVLLILSHKREENLASNCTQEVWTLQSWLFPGISHTKSREKMSESWPVGQAGEEPFAQDEVMSTLLLLNKKK